MYNLPKIQEWKYVGEYDRNFVLWPEEKYIVLGSLGQLDSKGNLIVFIVLVSKGEIVKVPFVDADWQCHESVIY